MVIGPVTVDLSRTRDVTASFLCIETDASEDGWIVEASSGLQTRSQWSQARLPVHINTQGLLVSVMLLWKFSFFSEHQFVSTWTAR